MANFCSNCGHELDGAGAFCKYCGAPLSAPAQSAPPQSVQAGQPAQQSRQQPQQWAQPQQQTQPQQWAPQSQWSPPPTASGAPQQQWAQQPASSGQWQTISGSASGGAAGWATAAAEGWNSVRSAIHNPAAAVTQAVSDYEDAHLPNAAAGKSGPNARFDIPAPGWSDRVNDPELLSALEKQRKSARKLGAIIIPLPLIGFAIYGAVSDKMELKEALIYGAIVSVIFLIISLLSGKKASGKNAYEAVVIDKRTHRRRRNNGRDEDGGRDYTFYTELTTVVRTTTGEQKKIVEADDSRTFAWDYLQIGERFRYHPQFAFPYELYDKSHAPCLYCAVCEKKNDVTADRCRKCGAPLLK